MENKYVIANWKQNKNLEEIRSWVEEFKNLVNETEVNCNVIISAPSIYLSELKQTLNFHKNLHVAAQNVSFHNGGSHTGEVSAKQLSDFTSYSVIGHSERKESRMTVLQKLENCIENNIKPILCFVEPEDPVFYLKFIDNVIFALEDPTNISVGGDYKSKNPMEIKSIVKLLKSYLPKDSIVVYGGSVNKDNIDEIADIEDLDGVLVGNASLDPKHFIQLIKAFS